MKKFITYTLTYVGILLIINFFYTAEKGNLFFLIHTFFGLVYNLLVIFTTNILPKGIRFLSAGFIGCLTSFLIFNGGIIPLIYLKDFDFISANAFGKYLTYDMLLKFNNVTALANIFYWMGYISKLGDYFFSLYYEGFKYKKALKLNINPLFPKVLIVLGLFLSFVLFVNGAYGRADVEVDDYSGVLRIMISFASYIEKIPIIGYFILALLYFKTGKHKVWFWMTLLIQIMFALVSGARGPIIFLFILTVLPYYYVNRKITKQIIVGGFITLMVAFTVASEIKEFTKSITNQNVAITDYAESYMEFREQSSAELNRKIYASVYYSILRRLNTVAQGSAAVKYKDEHGVDKTDPEFVGELLTAPIYIFIPRSVFGTGFPAWGQWFRLKVFQQRNDTYHNNITFGMVGFFYLAGGWLFIPFGFFFYGVMLRFSNNILEVGSGLSFLVYLAILSAIGYITASVPSSFVAFSRFIIFLPLFFYVIIRTLNRIRL